MASLAPEARRSRSLRRRRRCALSLPMRRPCAGRPENDILTLDPHSQNHATTNAILMHAYEGLTRYGVNREVEPALATKWTYVSPTQVRFELRQRRQVPRRLALHGRRRHLLLHAASSQPQGAMQIYVTGVNEIRKVDDHTGGLDPVGPEPDPAAQHHRLPHHEQGLGGEEHAPPPSQDYKAKEENFASRHVMGTGPYQITGWTPEQRVTMTINNDWWDKHTNNVKEVIYTAHQERPDPRGGAAVRRRGPADGPADPGRRTAARSDAKLKVVDGPEVRTIYFAPDIGSPELKYSNIKGQNPFADKRVRQAHVDGAWTARPSSATSCAGCRCLPASWWRPA
jgi:peptide/nickel transport system substrate-binding protein